MTIIIIIIMRKIDTWQQLTVLICADRLFDDKNDKVDLPETVLRDPSTEL